MNGKGAFPARSLAPHLIVRSFATFSVETAQDEIDGFVAGWSYRGISLSEMLRSAGMVTVEDFVTTSPLVLHTSCGIPVRAVELLYIGAEKMIKMVHKEMAHEIKDLREHREDYGRLYLDNVDESDSV